MPPSPRDLFAETSVQALFPTCVWVYDLKPEVHEPMNRRLLATLDALTDPKPVLPPGRNWQTEQTLHEVPEFAELMEIGVLAARGVLDAIAVKYTDIMITGAWANINPKGAGHPPHIHPNNYLSGVYYLHAPTGGDSITFHDPRKQIDLISPEVKKPNVYNSPIHMVKIQSGRMVLFPAWLGHSVVANQNQELRVSVSLNFMFPNFAETMGQPKWPGLPLKRTGGSG
jgi:uncharacterized protein (TIGR02466 family)